MHDVEDIIKIFKKYPTVFPGGYFRFLKANLIKKIDKKELLYRNGVVLTWTKYKRAVSLAPHLKAAAGDIKINQLVNEVEGNGEAKKLFLDFLSNTPNTIFWLGVREDNERAVKFYEKNGFVKVADTKYGGDNGIIMKRIK